MNGIIHNCIRSTPGNGGHDSKRYASCAPISRSTSQIFLDVFKYIDNLFSLVPPSKLLYMAIDGVAPRAKMNQQRSRRFRSAKERAEEHERLMADDPVYGASKFEPFDSNCITPGTEFMRKLSEALRYFVAKKITEDRRWQNISVVLSGAEVPGEGEHKIMEYIRAVRESGALQPNTRHCVYGLDADLIMLALITHEPHFFVLREKVDFTAFWRKKGGPRIATTLDTAVFGEFEFLSVGVLREYLELELGANGNDSLPFFDVERITDDFVFILMLIGNDFLPHLPTLDIATGTLGVMLHLYKRVLPIMGGYMTDGGRIIPQRLEYFFAKLSMLDKSVMRSKNEAEEQAAQGRRRSGKSTVSQVIDLDELFGFGPPNARKVLGPLSGPELLEEAISCRQRVEDEELLELKTRYYYQKFGTNFGAPESRELNELTQCYVEGIWWTLRYYTEGCRHWRWFYPFHYAPLASDIFNISSKLAIYEHKKFVNDQPFRPLEQLLSVLPEVSSWCLPKPYRELMINASSPIRDFYPNDFPVDMNGKRNDWEAVVLLPFVNEIRLMQAIESIPSSSLTSEEIQRNKHGSSFVYRYCLTWSQEQVSPFDIQLPSFVSRAKRVELKLPSVQAGKSFTASKLPGTCSPVENTALADMPSLHMFPLNARLECAGLNIFGTPSRSESLLIEPIFGPNTGKEPSRENPAGGDQIHSIVEGRGLAVGSAVWYGYPWRMAGHIDCVMNTAVTKRLSTIQNGTYYGQMSARVEEKPTNMATLKGVVDIMVANMVQGCGVVLSAPTEIVGVKGIADSRASSSDADTELVPSIWHPLFVRRRDSVHLTRSTVHAVNERLVEGQTVLFISNDPFSGHKATVRAVSKNALVTVEFGTSVPALREPAFGYRVVSISRNQERWVSLSKLATEIGIPVLMADCSLGSIRVRLQSGKEEIDLGLGIKYIGRALFIPGYARLDERHHYCFSDKAIDVLRRYKNAFPKFFATLGNIRSEEAKSGSSKNRGSAVYSSKDLFGIGKRGDDAARAISTWLSVQEVANLPLTSALSSVLPQRAVAELEKHASLALTLQESYAATFRGEDASNRTREVARDSLLTGTEGANWGIDWCPVPFNAPTPIPPNCEGVRLGDRVVNRVAEGSVPFGLRGTVVGIHPPEALEKTNADKTSCGLIEVVFDEGFIGGSTLNGRCSAGRGKAVQANTIFIVRPDSENAYYRKHYARVAAQMGSLVARRRGEEQERSKQVEEIANASIRSYVNAVSKPAGNAREGVVVQEQSIQAKEIAVASVRSYADAVKKRSESGGEIVVVEGGRHRRGDVREDCGSKERGGNGLGVRGNVGTPTGTKAGRDGQMRQTSIASGERSENRIELRPKSLPLPKFVTERRQGVVVGVGENKGWVGRRRVVSDARMAGWDGGESGGDRAGTGSKGDVSSTSHANWDATLMTELLKRDLGLYKEKGDGDAKLGVVEEETGSGRGKRCETTGGDDDGDDADELASMWANLQRTMGQNSTN